MARSKALDWILVTLLLLGAAWRLAPVLDCDFLTDDFHVIRFVTYGPESSTAFDPQDSTEVLRYFGMRATDRFQLYRPLVALAFRLSWDRHGLEPLGYHVENLLLHLLGGLMVWLLARQVFPEGSRLLALAGCALFLLHPLQMQVVSWTAARSDSLAWLLGAAGLYLRLRSERAWMVSLFLMGLALFAKESALVFPAAALAIELLDREGTGGRRVARMLGPMLPVALYLALRSQVMSGELIGARYAGRSFIGILGADGLDNLMTSTWTALQSVSSLFLPSGWPPLALGIPIAAIQVALLGAGILALGRTRPRLLPAFLLLLVVPFVLAGLVSRLDDNFHNSRACYLSLGAVGVFVAGLRPTRISIAFLLALFVLLLPVSGRVVDYYVFASRSSAAMLDEIRGALAPFADGRHREVAILNFQEESWFRGGFVFSGALDPALMRPFTGQDWRLRKVAADRTLRGFSPLVEIAELCPDPRADLVLLAMHADPDERRQDFRLLYPLAATGAAAPGLEIVAPGNGAEILLDPEQPASMVPRYRVRHDHGDGEGLRHRVFIFTRNADCIRAEAEITATEVGPEGTIRTLELPALPDRMAEDPAVLGTVLLGIDIIDRDDRVVDSSPLMIMKLRSKQ